MAFKEKFKRTVFILALKTFLIQNIHAHILRLPCLTYGNFSITRSNHKLTGHLLQTFNNLNVDECEQKCVQHRLCKSINTNGAAICELNSKSTEDPFDNVRLSANNGWTYKATDHKAKAIGPFCEYNNPCSSYHDVTCIDTCYCPGYTCEKASSTTFRDCQDAYSQGHKKTEIYPISINGTEVYARCDMDKSGGGWIVFQRRVDASVDFDRNWDEYKKGFGDLNGNFWLGLEKIHKLAAPGKGAILRVDLRHLIVPTQVIYAEYSTFEISGEDEFYKLNADGYTGNASDSLSYHSGHKFTTKDKDNDDCPNNENCAVNFKGAWWFNTGYYSALNNLYPPDENQNPTYISWLYNLNTVGKVTFTEMKLKYSQQPI